MTTTGHRTAADVVVVDLRDWRGDSLPQVAGLVVVIDDAAGLTSHETVYDALVKANQVHHLLCVVVGEPTERKGDGVLLELPWPLVFGRSTILWVGHEHGVRWSPADKLPLPAAVSFPSGLDHLVEALRIPEVFTQVRGVLEHFKGNAASPGTVLVSGAVDADELAQARSMVVRRLTRFQPDGPVPPPLEDPTSFALDRELPATVLAGTVAATRRRADDSVKSAQKIAGIVTGWGALFRKSDDHPTAADPDSGRPGQKLGAQVRIAARDAEAYRKEMATVLHHIDGNLRVGRPGGDEIVRAGVRPPTPVNPAHVADEVAKLVHEAGRRRYSLSTLAAQLRYAAAAAAPQGCTPVADELAGMSKITREPPKFRRLPLWGWTWPLIFLTSFVVALLPLPGWSAAILAGLFAVLWVGAGWFLLARRPNDDGSGELGFADSVRTALQVYGLPGVLGVAGGIALADLLYGIIPDLLAIPPRIVGAVVGVAAGLFVAIVIVSWPTAARAWVRGMRLDALERALNDVMQTADRGIRNEWLPSARRRMVAEAFTEAAAALTEISDVIAKSAAEGAGSQHDGYAAPGGLGRVVLDELLDVLATDLVAVAQHAVAPAWTVLGGGRRHPAGTYKDNATELLRQYKAHITRHGLLVTPPFVEDNGPRERLLHRRWVNAPEAERALRVRANDEMVQLCDQGHVDWINGQVEPRLVRFAPHPVEGVLKRDPVRNRAILQDRPIWTTAGEMAGAVRLVPLRDDAIGTARRD